VGVTVTEAAAESCSQLINTYIRYGGTNNSKDVEELQFFLKTLEGFEDVSETGVYDEATYNAVRSFQTKYASDILDPWGMSTPSGYVYYTTQKKVNEIWCDDLDFSLTDEQRNEIDSFKGRSRNFIERKIEDQDSGEYELYGQAPSDDDSYIALNAEPAVTQEEQGADILQVANVAQVANSFGGFWNTVRSGITNAFSFLKF
jgi:peptidoglycan hydrolase-like protein with peptidoglycan-binding domain